MSNPTSDQEILHLISAGQGAQAAVRIQYRQMIAAEELANTMRGIGQVLEEWRDARVPQQPVAANKLSVGDEEALQMSRGAMRAREATGGEE